MPISPVMMPPVTGVPNSHLLFDVAFAVVVLSLLIRGMTIPVMARLLKVAMPNKPEPKDTHDIWLAKKEIVRMSAFKVVAESEAEGHHPDTVEPISDSFGARCFALIRNGIRIEMQSDTVLQAGIWRGTSCPTARSKWIKFKSGQGNEAVDSTDSTESIHFGCFSTLENRSL
ncbi:sodium:proton exchanger [Neisseria meningitidis]|uniref:sodium:proton exchanger n=1 Tax=Neisseria meningitidis TaxID=487 RepID=UPI001E3A9915|nr:sodium:proton exchanger [Neisseria meningitidis]